jgi:myo-inositol-1(or 4)-monophosphatase
MHLKLKTCLHHLPQIREELLATHINDIDEKDAFDNIVTNVDLLIQDRLISLLQHEYPETSFLAEEEEQFQISDHMWVIDPIDGTKNFVRKHEDYAISIAYYEFQKPIFGLVYDIAKDLLYYAEVGQGVYLNNQALKPRLCTQLRDAILDVNLNTVYFFEQQKQANFALLNQKTFAHRSFGSGALSLCRIALGTHDIYMSSHLKFWDYAASKIILEEAGGVVHLPYEKASLFHTKSQVIVACSTEALYQEVQNILFNQ